MRTPVAPLRPNPSFWYRAGSKSNPGRSRRAGIRWDPGVRVDSDEVYEAILFDGAQHRSIASLPGMEERTVVVSCVSKTYSWTGGRVGWAVFPTAREAAIFTNFNIKFGKCYSGLEMGAMLAEVAGVLLRVQNLASAVVLAAFFSLFFRSFLLLLLDRGRGALVVTIRVLSGWIFLTFGWLYSLFVAHSLVWDASTLGMAVVTALLVHAGFAFRRITDREGSAPGPIAFLVHVVLMLTLLLVAALTLMRAGFLALSEDRTVLLVDVTGETGMQRVRWAPPDREVREEDLVTHHVVFRTPAGAAVGETWVYGDQVAVKGRVLRLSPVLNAAGVANQFELLFAHNGYTTMERHATYPHTAVALPPMGPLAVHPWWRPLQARLLEKWERRSSEGSAWAIRSVTTESTYYPLVDSDSKPVRQTFRLVLTPGGLSAS